MESEIIDVIRDFGDKISEFSELVNEYTFKLTQIPESEMGIKVYKDSEGYYHCTCNYEVKTPFHGSSYLPIHKSRSKTELMSNFIDVIHGLISEAIANGYEPDKSWLVKNEDY